MQSHDVFVRQISIVFSKIPLNNVLVRLTLHLDFGLVNIRINSEEKKPFGVD